MRFHLLVSLFLLVSVNALADGDRCVVLRAAFKDVAFSSDETTLKESVDRAGEYFGAQFPTSRSISFDMGPVVTLKGRRADYASNSSDTKDTRIGEAVKEACLLSDISIDFSKYGYLAVMFPGESESDGGGTDCVWPQQSSISAYTQPITLDGKKLDCFIDFTETGKAGIICHEFLHLMGLSDMYDTDGEWSGGLSKGLWGGTSVMDKGLLNDRGNTPPDLNAIELETLGIGECIGLTEGRHILQPIGIGKKYLKSCTGVDGEYFLLECRGNDMWDKHIGGSGLIVYHMDRSAGNAWYSDWFKRNLTGAERWQYNQVNCRPDHQCARIVEASPIASNVSEVFFPIRDGQSFSSDTDPCWNFWNGKTSELALTDIRRCEDGAVSFNVIRPVKLTSCTAFQDAVILEWSIDSSLEGYGCELSWVGKSGSGTIDVQGTGCNFAFTADGLTPGTDYTFIIRAVHADSETFSISTSCTTKSIYSGAHPYIWLKGADRREDGSFVKGSSIILHVFNAADAAEVKWYLDGAPVSPLPNGRFVLNSGGELKAAVYYLDGGIDIIVKKLDVR